MRYVSKLCAQMHRANHGNALAISTLIMYKALAFVFAAQRHGEPPHLDRLIEADVTIGTHVDELSVAFCPTVAQLLNVEPLGSSCSGMNIELPPGIAQHLVTRQ